MQMSTWVATNLLEGIFFGLFCPLLVIFIGQHEVLRHKHLAQAHEYFVRERTDNSGNGPFFRLGQG